MKNPAASQPLQALKRPAAAEPSTQPACSYSKMYYKTGKAALRRAVGGKQICEFGGKQFSREHLYELADGAT